MRSMELRCWVVLSDFRKRVQGKGDRKWKKEATGKVGMGSALNRV